METLVLSSLDSLLVASPTSQFWTGVVWIAIHRPKNNKTSIMAVHFNIFRKRFNQGKIKESSPLDKFDAEGFNAELAVEERLMVQKRKSPTTE